MSMKSIKPTEIYLLFVMFCTFGSIVGMFLACLETNKTKPQNRYLCCKQNSCMLLN